MKTKKKTQYTIYCESTVFQVYIISTCRQSYIVSWDTIDGYTTFRVQFRSAKELAMTEFFCQRYPTQGCDTCASQCYGWQSADGDPNAPCEQWTPCRGGHPSTPNPCECSSSEEYGLCLGECAGCQHIHWNQH